MINVTIQNHPSKYRWVVIYVDDEPWREVAALLVKDRSLCAKYSSLKVWEETWNAWEEKQAKLLAFNKLSRKRYFIDELKRQLSRYGIASEVIEKVLEKISEQGYLDDQDGLESLISKGIRQQKGPMWIAQYLQQKGVATASLGKAIQEHYPSSLREENIRLLLNKKKREGRKAIAFVARRGFALDEIIRVYNTL